MKTLIFYMALALCFTATAQENDKSLLSDTKLFKNLKFSRLMLDMGYINGTIKNANMGGAEISAVAVYNDNYATGFCFETVGKHGVFIEGYQEVINPDFSFTSITWRNEFLIGAKHILNVSFPIDLGLGMSEYSDDYYTTENGSPTIASSTFFAAKTGVNLNVKLFKHTAIYLGARYRYTAGAARIGTDSDYTNYTLNSGLRLLW